MKSIFLGFLFLLIFAASGFADQKVVIVQSSRIAPYEAAVQSFKNSHRLPVSSSGLKSISPISIENYILSDQNDIYSFAEKLSSVKPDVVVAVGAQALAASVDAGVPVVYLMVSSPEEIVGNRKNITGVHMELSPELQLKRLFAVAPGLERIGLIFRQSLHGKFAASAETYIHGRGFSLISAPVSTAREISAALSRMSGRIDAVWMLPDPNLVSRETMEAMVLFSMKNKTPIITFSEKYLKRGAALSISFDPEGLGEQAAGMVNQLLVGFSVEKLPPQDPISTRIIANKRILNKLNLKINESKELEIEYADWD